MRATIITYTLAQIHTHTPHTDYHLMQFILIKKTIKNYASLTSDCVREREGRKCECLVYFARCIFICSLYNSLIFLALVENRRKRTCSIKGRKRLYVWNVLHSLHCSQMNYGRFRCFFHFILLPVYISVVCVFV